jgi:hypothetical protein
MTMSHSATAASSVARDPDLCVITCAVTGVLANRKQCPHIPYTPVEIAEEAKRAYDAGASVLHIHARRDDGSPTFEPATFARIKEEIQNRRIAATSDEDHASRKRMGGHRHQQMRLEDDRGRCCPRRERARGSRGQPVLA